MHNEYLFRSTNNYLTAFPSILLTNDVHDLKKKISLKEQHLHLVDQFNRRLVKKRQIKYISLANQIELSFVIPSQAHYCKLHLKYIQKPLTSK